jgi:molybdate transport system substrate-binding protein
MIGLRRRSYFCALLLMSVLPSVSSPALAAEPVAVFAAGSLRAVLSDIATGFTRDTGTEVRFTFGPSGLLKERIEKGEVADVFASANM